MVHLYKMNTKIGKGQNAWDDIMQDIFGRWIETEKLLILIFLLWCHWEQLLENWHTEENNPSREFEKL